MRRAAILAALVVATLGGCATFSARRDGNNARFDAGIKALQNGDYSTAEKNLSIVAEQAPDKEIGQRALLTLAALHMDPRNGARKPELGAELAARFLRLPERDDWVDPVAQTLYLLGLELGEAEQRAERAEQAQQEAQRTRELPKLPGPTVTARIKAIEQERDRLAKRVATLEDQLAQSQRELERIRKTIKP